MAMSENIVFLSGTRTSQTPNRCSRQHRQTRPDAQAAQAPTGYLRYRVAMRLKRSRDRRRDSQSTFALDHIAEVV
jgi:hypothetical protein